MHRNRSLQVIVGNELRSDLKSATMGSSAARWHRKAFDHRIRTDNDLMLHRWLVDPEFDPVFRAWHKHDANGSWGDR
jgi:hypothetical protein